MNSCFVTNAAAIAKRKLEQKPDKKDKKAENSKKHETAQKNTAEPKMKVCKRTFMGNSTSFYVCLF